MKKLFLTTLLYSLFYSSSTQAIRSRIFLKNNTQINAYVKKPWKKTIKPGEEKVVFRIERNASHELPRNQKISFYRTINWNGEIIKIKITLTHDAFFHTYADYVISPSGKMRQKANVISKMIKKKWRKYKDLYITISDK